MPKEWHLDILQQIWMVMFSIKRVRPSSTSDLTICHRPTVKSLRWLTICSILCLDLGRFPFASCIYYSFVAEKWKDARQFIFNAHEGNISLWQDCLHDGKSLLVWRYHTLRMSFGKTWWEIGKGMQPLAFSLGWPSVLAIGLCRGPHWGTKRIICRDYDKKISRKLQEMRTFTFTSWSVNSQVVEKVLLVVM